MRNKPFIVPLKKGLKKEDIGNKTSSILFLQKHRFRIPETFVVLGIAYDAFRNDPEATLVKLRSEISRLPDHDYMVRSSSSLEDAGDFSFAGQFKSLGDVRGSASLVKAIEEVWKFPVDPETIYPGATDPVKQQMKVALILQRRIPSLMAGVSFSKNPVNNRNEIIIEAVEGPGGELMQKGVTPLRWRFRKQELTEGEANHGMFTVIREVAASTAQLKKLHGGHIDIEWVYDGRHVYYVQLRSITGTRKVSIYSNKVAQEVLPGQIKPLVWSVNIPLVNSAWINILSSITGPLDIQPEDLAKSFYYRTYFNVAALGEIFREFGVSMESLEHAMLFDSGNPHSFRPGFRTLRHTFRIIRFMGMILRFERFFLKEYGDLLSRYRALALKLNEELAPGTYSAFFQELFDEGKRLAHLNIVIPILMRIYNNLLTRKLKRIGINIDQLSFTADFPEIDHHSPLPSIRQIRDLIEELPPVMKEKCTSYEQLSREEGAGHIRSEMESFMERFGHLSESGNDFSYPKWEEDPEFVYKMILDHSGQKKQQHALQFREIRYSRLSHPRLRAVYERAGRFRVYREQISSLFIYGYGLFRTLFLKLADGLVDEGILQERNDIFYLTITEVDALVDRPDRSLMDRYASSIRQRKDEMEASRELILPSVIYGEEAPLLEREDLKNFSGTGTSPGHCTGRTRVIRESADFVKVVDGDVLIIPFSDVSWTPVLCRAGAIVAESGGMLSHCSIIAREMGIPSLVSVDNACTLADDLLVTVDGSNGILTVHDHE